MDTRDQIISRAVQMFAHKGVEGFSIRILAKEVGIAPSVLYYYFENKEFLLKAMFDEINTLLGKERAKLPPVSSVEEMLRQRVLFQLEHAEEIVAVLRYYLVFRDNFKQLEVGFIPKKGYLHIEEVLLFGIENGELDPETNIEEDAKVITHAINGFILEYYPQVPTDLERKQLVDQICGFLLRGLQWKKRKK